MRERKVTESVRDSVAAPAVIRESVVESVLAGLRAAQLSGAEYLCVVGAILELIARAETEKPAVVVVTAAVQQGRVESFASVLESSAPLLVASTADLMVRMASPHLWAAVRGALEASDAEILARAALRVRFPEAGN
jgi:hypothetical protein